MPEKFIELVTAGQSLTSDDARTAINWLLTESVPASSKADFLCELARKGETVEEIAGFASALRERAIVPPLDAETRSREILDVCGTGGDRLGTFNISTTVAIVCAAAGVTVAKHGNRAITSQAGSADVLEALGVRIDLPPADAARSLREHNFAFFFAPNFHPAFKFIAPARKLCAERGERTIFNFLGPLLNPARPTAQLVGVPRPELCEPVAHVLQALGARRGMVVCGEVSSATCQASGANGSSRAYLDELSTLSGNTIAEFYQERGFSTSILQPDQFPLQPAKLDDLLGGGKETNANIVRAILRGEDKGAKLDAVLLNAAAALFVASEASSIVEGWETAAEVIASGKAWAKLLALSAR